MEEDVAVALEQRAAERAIGVSDVMADLLAGDELAGLHAERLAGEERWSPAEIVSVVATPRRQALDRELGDGEGAACS